MILCKWAEVAAPLTARFFEQGAIVRRVFLSHSSKNLKEVVRFDDQLRRHGVPLWRDRIDLAKGAPTEDEIRRAGNDAIGFAFYLTPQSAESEWVRIHELEAALTNAARDNSFGIVPVFRGDRDAITKAMIALAKDGDPRYDLRKNNGHIIRAIDDLTLESDLATAATVVLHSFLRTVRKQAVTGSRLRIAAVTRSTTPWNTHSADMALDWSAMYPTVSDRLPTNGIGETQLLPALQRTIDAIDHVWGDKRIQIVAHCHPSMAFAVGFGFRRNSGFDLEVVDHATTSRHVGPARPSAPERELWVEALTEAESNSRDIAIGIGVSRDVSEDMTRTLLRHGLDPDVCIALTPRGGASNAAIALTDSSLQHRMAVSAVQRIIDAQARRGVGVVHLFAAIPGTLAVLIGQQLTNIGRVQLYDFDNERREYSPVMELFNR